MKLAVIGTGYVGLVTGTCFAESGNEVCCIDKDAGKIQMLENGGCPSTNPVYWRSSPATAANPGCTSPPTSPLASLPPSILIAVGTPQMPDGSADLSTVWAVTDAWRGSSQVRKSSSSKAPCRSAPIARLPTPGRAQYHARRGEQSGVPERRSGGRGLHPARSRGRRRSP